MSSEKVTVSPAVRASSHIRGSMVAPSLKDLHHLRRPEHTVMVRGGGAFVPLSKDLCRPEHEEATKRRVSGSRVDDCCRTRGRD